MKVAGIERPCLVQAAPRVLVIDPRGEGIHVELSRVISIEKSKEVDHGDD